MINLTKFMGIFIVLASTFSCLIATEEPLQKLNIGNPHLDRNKEIFHGIKTNSKQELPEQMEYVNKEIEDLKNEITRMESLNKLYKKNDNTYLTSYRSMIIELEDIKKTNPNMSLADSKIRVGEIYAKYFPQDDE